VTPIPLSLDGERHELRRPLEAIAHTLRPGSSVTLQITASATNYGPQRATGLVSFKHVDLQLPVVRPSSKRR
jgi:ABC-2 type transport system ATP-binding protein